MRKLELRDARLATVTRMKVFLFLKKYGASCEYEIQINVSYYVCLHFSGG